MSIFRAFICLAALALIFDTAAATNFTVGGPTGSWDTNTNLQTWASSQSFLVGDNLVFQYTPNHDVLEVTQANYDNCQASNPLQTNVGGITVIPLVATGKRYFICGTSGHCAQGMKVEVDTLAATSPAPPPTSTVTPPPSSPTPAGSPTSSPAAPESPANTPPPPTTSVSSPPPPPSSATKVKLMVGSTVGLGFVSMMLLAL
ncbi:hypothetical protein LguiA_022673 [Lonicera macranthoides]